MAEKNISKIRLSNDNENYFVLKSKDFDKVNELYTEVFGDSSNDGLKKYVQTLENKIAVLERKVESLYNGQVPSGDDDSYESNDQSNDDKILVNSIVVTKVTVGNTVQTGDLNNIAVPSGQPVSFEWEVLPANADNKNVKLSSDSTKVVISDDNSIAAITDPGVYSLSIVAEDGSKTTKTIQITVEE